MKYKYLLFDLDGTLWDSREGITKAVAYALEKMGYPVPEQQELSKFIGAVDGSFSGVLWDDAGRGKTGCGIFPGVFF